MRRARDVEGSVRDVFVFQLRPVGEVLRRPQDANAFSGVSEVVPVGVHSVPTEAAEKLTYEYQQVGTKTARKHEAELAERFETYLIDQHNHEVKRYKIATAGSSGHQFTDLADTTAKVLYEAKGIANRMSVRLALGQVLDYGRYVKEECPGTELSLLPKPPPGDMIELFQSLGIGCVVEQSPGEFVDETGLGRCP